nr:hypothetical protein [Tanacetum cinerariifolium]
MLPYTSWALLRSGMRRNNKRELAHEVVTEWKLVYQVDRLCCSVGDPSSICCCYVADRFPRDFTRSVKELDRSTLKNF